MNFIKEQSLVNLQSFFVIPSKLDQAITDEGVSDSKVEQKDGGCALKNEEMPPVPSEDQRQQSPPHSPDPFDTSSNQEDDKERGGDYNSSSVTEEVMD